MATLCAAQPCLVASGGVPLRRRRTETHPSPFPTRIDSFPFAPERLAGLGAMPPPATVAAASFAGQPLDDAELIARRPPPLALAWSGPRVGGRLLAAADEDGCVALLGPSGGGLEEPPRGWRAHRNAIFALAWSHPGDARIVTGAGDHTARVWDVERCGSGGEPACLAELVGHWGSVKAVAPAPCGEIRAGEGVGAGPGGRAPPPPDIVATGGRDGAVLLWDTRLPGGRRGCGGPSVRDGGQADGAPLQLPVAALPGAHAPAASTVTGRRRRAPVSVAGAASPGEPALGGPSGSVTSVRWLHDPWQLASGGTDGVVRVWDARRLLGPLAVESADAAGVARAEAAAAVSVWRSPWQACAHPAGRERGTSALGRTRGRPHGALATTPWDHNASPDALPVAPKGCELLAADTTALWASLPASAPGSQNPLPLAARRAVVALVTPPRCSPAAAPTAILPPGPAYTPARAVQALALCPCSRRMVVLHARSSTVRVVRLPASSPPTLATPPTADVSQRGTPAAAARAPVPLVLDDEVRLGGHVPGSFHVGIAASPCGSFVVAGGGKGEAAVWALPGGGAHAGAGASEGGLAIAARLLVLPGGGEEVTAVAWGGDEGGGRLATASDAGGVRVWGIVDSGREGGLCRARWARGFADDAASAGQAEGRGDGAALTAALAAARRRRLPPRPSLPRPPRPPHPAPTAGGSCGDVRVRQTLVRNFFAVRPLRAGGVVAKRQRAA